MAEITLLDDKEPEPEEGVDDPVRYVVTVVNFHQMRLIWHLKEPAIFRQVDV